MALHQIPQKMQLFICNMLHYMVNHTQTELALKGVQNTLISCSLSAFIAIYFRKKRGLSFLILLPPVYNLHWTFKF